MLRKNQFEIAPSYSGYYLHVADKDVLKINNNWKNSYALNIGYGLSNEFNLAGYYEHSDFPISNRYGKSNGLDYFQLEPKFELDRNRNAISFPIGYANIGSIKWVQFGTQRSPIFI